MRLKGRLGMWVNTIRQDLRRTAWNCSKRACCKSWSHVQAKSPRHAYHAVPATGRCSDTKHLLADNSLAFLAGNCEVVSPQ